MSANVPSASRDAMSVPLFTNGQSLLFPRPWSTVSLFYWDVQGYTPSVTGTWGSNTNFQLVNNICTYFGKMLYRTVIAGTPVLGSYRYDDFLAYAAIEEAFVQYGSQRADTLHGEYMKFKFYDEMCPTNKRLAIREQIQGPLPAAQRQLNLVNGCRTLVELPFYFTRGYRASFPMVLGADLQISIKLRSFQQVVDSDDGELAAPPATPNILEQVLLVQQFHGAPDESTQLQSHAASTGIFKLQDYPIKETFTEQAASNVTRLISVDMKQTNLPTSYQTIILRFLPDLTTPYRTRRWQLHGGLQDPDCRYTQAPAWNTSNGYVRTPNHGLGLVKPYQESWFRGDTPGLLDHRVVQDVSLEPYDANNSSGAISIQGLSGFKVELNVEFPSGIARQLQVDIFNTAKRILKYQSGNLIPVIT